jgi:hypothetical protein
VYHLKANVEVNSWGFFPWPQYNTSFIERKFSNILIVNTSTINYTHLQLSRDVFENNGLGETDRR